MKNPLGAIKSLLQSSVESFAKARLIEEQVEFAESYRHCQFLDAATELIDIAFWAYIVYKDELPHKALNLIQEYVEKLDLDIYVVPLIMKAKLTSRIEIGKNKSAERRAVDKVLSQEGFSLANETD